MALRQELRMTRKFSSPEEELNLNLQRTVGLLSKPLLQFLKGHRLSPAQYNILRILRGAKGKAMCMHEITARMLDRAPNATRLTDKLCQKKLVVRERSEEDRRVVHLHISPEGKDLLEKIDEHSGEELLRLARKLPKGEALQVNAALDKLRS